MPSSGWRDLNWVLRWGVRDEEQNGVGGATYHFWQELFMKPFSSPKDNLWQMFHRHKVHTSSGLLSITVH